MRRSIFCWGDNPTEGGWKREEKLKSGIISPPKHSSFQTGIAILSFLYISKPETCQPFLDNLSFENDTGGGNKVNLIQGTIGFHLGKQKVNRQK
jgi:hypothetical protein